MTRAQALEVLGLEVGATEEQVKAAYRSLSKRVHPDAGGTDELFRRVNDAYETLTEGLGFDDEAEPSDTASESSRGASDPADHAPPQGSRRSLRWWEWPFLAGLGPTSLRGCVALLVVAVLVGAQVGSGLPQLLRQMSESLFVLLAVGRIAALPLRVRRR